jgi:murein L,D-transpeptidase YafK
VQRLSRRSFVASTLALALTGCSSYTGDNRSLIPLSSNATAGLRALTSSPAEPMVVRIFKESSELEVWKQTQHATYTLFKRYQICRWSGVLGPKLQEGDRQAPEGFYSVTPGMLNPRSALYLSFNTGFPNKYDRANGRTGTNLMVHGGCSSAGCYAMTDDEIKEIYALARESFGAGNASFQLQMFPFRMTSQNMDRYSSNANIAFWKNLKEGSDLFESTLRPPAWDVCDRRYVFADSASTEPQLLCDAPAAPVPAPAPAFQS